MSTRNVIWKSAKINVQQFTTETRGMKQLTGATAISIPIPSVEDTEGRVTPLQELVHLMKVAAEVEHALMIQYLYAAYSITDRTSSVQSDIILVAIQEMGHLLSVQNLLVCLGGTDEIYLEKNILSQAKGFSIVPYKLEKFSRTAVAKFVSVERPLSIADPTLAKEVDDILKIAANSTGMTPNAVAGLYIKIFWLFQPDDKPIPPFNLTPDGRVFVSNRHIADSEICTNAESVTCQADPAVWGSDAFEANDVILSVIKKRQDAIDLLTKITEQGEGPDIDPSFKSHFEIFLERYRNFALHPGLAVADLPNNPVTDLSRPGVPSDATVIQNDYSILWAKLFNNLYNTLLLDIHTGMFASQFPGFQPGSFALQFLYPNMHIAVKQTFAILTGLSLKPTATFMFQVPPICGAPFEADDMPFPKTKGDLLIAHGKYQTNATDLISQLSGHSFFGDHKTNDPHVNLVLSFVSNFFNNKMQFLSSI